MTKSNTELTMLTNEQIAEIEARTQNASPHYVVNWSKGEHALMQASGWRPLHEEQPRTIAAFDKEDGYFDLLFCTEARSDVPALCATVKQLQAETERVVDTLTQAHNSTVDDLQSQLEQLRAENERLLQEAMTATALAGRNVREQIKGVFGDQDIELRTRAVKACKDRAVEWGRMGLSNTWFAGKEEAANDLAAEMEKL